MRTCRLLNLQEVVMPRIQASSLRSSPIRQRLLSFPHASLATKRDVTAVLREGHLEWRMGRRRHRLSSRQRTACSAGTYEFNRQGRKGTRNATRASTECETSPRVPGVDKYGSVNRCDTQVRRRRASSAVYRGLGDDSPPSIGPAAVARRTSSEGMAPSSPPLEGRVAAKRPGGVGEASRATSSSYRW